MKNDRTLAEVILEQPLFLAFGDKLILRSGDAKILIGGAKVLEIHSPKRYKRTESRLAFLTKFNQAQNATQRIGLTLQKEAISVQALMWSEQLTENQLAEALAENGDIRFQKLVF